MTEEEKKRDKEEFKRKKQFLYGYMDAKTAIRKCELQLQELRAGQIMPSAGMSDMPKAHNQKDLSDYAAKLEEIEQQFVSERYNRIKQYLKVSNTIENLKNEDEKLILTLRYIKGLEWEEILEEIPGVSWRTMHRRHSKGVRNIVIDDEDQEIKAKEEKLA